MRLFLVVAGTIIVYSTILGVFVLQVLSIEECEEPEPTLFICEYVEEG